MVRQFTALILYFFLGVSIAVAAPLNNQANSQIPAELQQLLDTNAGKARFGNQETQTELSKQSEVAKMNLRSIAGDGLVKLAWTVRDLASFADSTRLTYSVIYGTEPGKPLFTYSAGTNSTAILRELKNSQPYYIKVIGTDRNQTVVVKSEEIRVVPLPSTELDSRIESAFSRQTLTLLDKIETVPLTRELKQFGYDFFQNTAQLAAVDTMPDNEGYQVGPGDQLNLSVWGAVDLRLELSVDRNGDLVIPRVGAVRVWGLPFEQARTAVHGALARYYKDFEMNLTLGRLRSVQVYVVGEVINPGRYPVSSMGTVINALAAAGGPSRNGSLRAIKVTRGNHAVAEVDLYEMLLSGDRGRDLRLQNGDTIFVPIIGPVVAVAGEVKRPAIYEIKGKTSLADVLKMAGGVSASGFTGRIQVERIVDNSSRIILDQEPKADVSVTLAPLAMQDRDMVKVFSVEEAIRQVVTLKGNVVRPGEYQLRKGMRLKDLIPSTRALLPESYLDSVEITRLSPPDWRRELLTVSLKRVLEGSEADNIFLQEQDAVKVFSRWEMEEKPKVAINGAVVTPGTYTYYPGMAVRDLVTAAGSLKRFAFLAKAELSRISIETDRAVWNRIPLDLGKALAGDPANNLKLQQDDVLIVRSVSDWQDATDKLVTLKGEFRFPGVYTAVRGEKISSVIARAGGFTEKAYLFGAKFKRKSVREQQQQRMDEIIIRTEREILQKQSALASTAASKEELEATKATLEGLMRSLDNMRKLKAEGRVVIELAQLDEFKKSSYDIELEGDDELEVPQRPGVVHVLGQVYNQTAFIYTEDAAEVGDFLNRAGGATREGEQSDIYVIRADGSVFSRQQSSFGINWSDASRSWSFGGFMSRNLMPGDTIVVPQKIERTAWMREIKDITQILANVALAAGSVYLWFK